MDIAHALDLIPALAAASAPIVLGARWASRRIGSLSRTVTALQSAVELHDAQSRGVVLVVTYPGHPRDAIPLLRQAGWTVAPYAVAAGEGDLPDTIQLRADLAAADVVLLQGQDAAGNSRLAGLRWFRDALGPGAAVVMYTPDSRSVFYDQRLWADGDQSVTVPATAEAAVRSAVARRRHIQALQGVRPGGLAAARAALPA